MLKVIIRLLYDLILYIYRLFINNIRIKRLESTFNDKEILPKIYQEILPNIYWYILLTLYLINIDKVLINLKLSRLIVLVTKTL